MSLKKLVRPEILDLPTINVPEALPEMIRLNANESPTSHWNEALNHSLHRYPPIRPYSIIKIIADLFEVQNDQILISRGSTEAIDIIIRTFCNPNKDQIIISPPTFDMYKFFATSNCIETIEIPIHGDNEFNINVKDLIKKLTDRTKIIFISSPNNPTGTSVSNDDIKYLLDAVKGRAIVVVDEAYIEFSSTKSLTREINNYNNLIILRTLSKAFSLAGIRCGAMISSSECSELLKKILPPFCFATPVIQFIKSALLSKDLQATKKQIEFLIKERERVKNELEKINCVNKIWKSDGNFLLVKFRDIDSVKNSLIDANVVVGLLKYPSLSDCARITIGTRDQNDELIEVLDNLN